MVSEPEAIYRQQALFPEAISGENDKGPGFGDTAFTRNRREPIHRWVPWIAGFSAAFVEEVLDSAVSGDPHNVTVLDPFAGVGTTLVEGLKRGHNVIGFEINPYAALACELKMASTKCKLDHLTNIIQKIENLRWIAAARKIKPKSAPPENFRSKTAFFSPSIEKQVLFIKDFISEQKEGFLKDAVKVALGAVMVSFSNYSYEPSLSTRFAAGKEDIENADVFRVVADKLWEIEADIGFLQRHMKRFAHEPAATIRRCSYLTGAGMVLPHTVDVLVTSPPYLNNYHYVRNTRPQIYWLGIVDGNEDLKDLEEESFGRFWQTVRAGPKVKLSFVLPELQRILEAIQEQNPEKGIYGGNGWANYAATYFNDCNRFFEATRHVMKPGGCVVVVIGNNIVQGVHVETDKLLARIGELHGFKVAGMHVVRRKRTGSSIVNSSVRAGLTRKPTELYETAVELQAPK
jgi:DNA modification methylase